MSSSLGLKPVSQAQPVITEKLAFCLDLRKLVREPGVKPSVTARG